jgi:epoxide hydrolase 4
MEIRHQQVIVGGVRLHVVTAGPEHGEPVVLLHGFPEDARAWDRQLGVLTAAGFRLIVPDLRGYHLSEKPHGVFAYRLGALVADVAGLIEQLAGGRAHLVGHDWGGVIAWATAMAHPGRVSKLVILNAPHPASARTFLKPAQLRRSWYVLFFQLPFFPERQLPRFGRRALHGINPAAYSGAERQGYLRAWQQPGAARSMINYYRALLRFPWRRLNIITAPTLVIWGQRDVALLPELAEPPRRWVPNLRIERLPRASHWVMRDEPARVSELLSEFLAD